MSLAGGLLGAMLAGGLLLVAAHVLHARRPRLEARVLPYVRDLLADQPRATQATPQHAFAAVYGPFLRHAADLVERTLGGSESVRRRLARARLDRTVHDFRVEQVLWGVAGFGLVAAVALARALSAPTAALPLVLMCCGGFALGVLLRDNRLTAQVKQREAAIVTEFPTVAELLALAVAAGEGPVAALDRVVARSRGELSRDLADVLSGVRTGEPVADAFDRLSATTGVPVVARFARGIAVALERGTPLADVLHAQAADVREAGRRDLIERASRKEILMMLPVVFLVMPLVVVVAFWPGYVGLTLTGH
ncbi:type II secretion system F family protein [Nocardioides ultimimeridianus]